MLEQFDGIEVEIVSAQLSGITAPVPGGMEKTVGGALPPMKRVVAAVAAGFSADLKKLSQELRPDEIQVEISLALSEEMNVWVIGAKGEQTLKLQLTWRSGAGAGDGNGTSR